MQTEDRHMIINELPLGMPGSVFVGPMPFGYFDPDGKALDDFKSKSVSVIVFLVEEYEYKNYTGMDLCKFYKEEGFDIIHYPLRDFSVPENGFFDSVVEKIIELANDNNNVAIHCHAGLGRAGMLAGLLVMRVLGLPAMEAIDWLRKYVPDALPASDQMQYLIKNDASVTD
ncbi:MAG: hypothetical protein IEMM0002_0732 [bacterium]|nr:MAG: hypothetical protein IEMM0002_0732 [bacterium]